jgi:hypothetical protein
MMRVNGKRKWYWSEVNEWLEKDIFQSSTEEMTGRSIHTLGRMVTGKGVSLIPTSFQPFPAMDRNVPINLEDVSSD